MLDSLIRQDAAPSESREDTHGIISRLSRLGDGGRDDEEFLLVETMGFGEINFAPSGGESLFCTPLRQGELAVCLAPWGGECFVGTPARD